MASGLLTRARVTSAVDRCLISTGTHTHTHTHRHTHTRHPTLGARWKKSKTCDPHRNWRGTRMVRSSVYVFNSQVFMSQAVYLILILYFIITFIFLPPPKRFSLLSICLENEDAKPTEHICVGFAGRMWPGPRKNSFKFGLNPDKGTDTQLFSHFLEHF